MNTQTFTQTVACPATANETFSIVWNNATDEHKTLTTSILAANKPFKVANEKAAFIAAACGNNPECGPRGDGVREYLMAPDEKVGVWMLCQGNKTWKISVALQAQYTYVEPKSTISGGSIAGIIIGSIVGALFVVGFAFMYWVRHAKNELPPASPESVRELQGEINVSPSAGDLNSSRAPASKAKEDEEAYESGRAPLSKVEKEG